MTAGAAAEIRFPRPPWLLLDELARQAVRNAGGNSAGDEWTWVEHGSNSLVVLAGDTAVRISRQPAGVAQLLRTQALVDALPDMPFAVARSRGEAVELEGHIAIPTDRLSGTPHSSGSGNPDELRRLLSAVHELDPQPLAEFLTRPHAFMGGDAWEGILLERVVPLLDARARPEARRRVGALAALRPDRSAVVHGDLAGSNVLWTGGRVTGILDWDLAAPGDPAEDVAALASWHDWSLVSELTDAQTATRAAAYRDTFALQVIAFGIINERPPAQIQRAVMRAERLLQAA
ncbi:phosphotransferase family protein [Gryllotalpicola reticulitermitis]|uniref:Phosphotransferase family protein n=1 Tax=Gryllotalpicola reticulitermitis TaxID=1184153 RepID=A0ABV8Q855_9MICO